MRRLSCLGSDAFGGDRQPERVREADHGGDDWRVIVIIQCGDE